MATHFKAWITATFNFDIRFSHLDYFPLGGASSLEIENEAQKIMDSIKEIASGIFARGILSVTGRIGEGTDLVEYFTIRRKEIKEEANFFHLLQERQFTGVFFRPGEVSESLGEIFIRMEAVWKAFQETVDKEEKEELKNLWHRNREKAFKVLIDLEERGILKMLNTVLDLAPLGVLARGVESEVREARKVAWEVLAIIAQKNGTPKPLPLEPVAELSSGTESAKDAPSLYGGILQIPRHTEVQGLSADPYEPGEEDLLAKPKQLNGKRKAPSDGDKPEEGGLGEFSFNLLDSFGIEETRQQPDSTEEDAQRHSSPGGGFSPRGVCNGKQSDLSSSPCPKERGHFHALPDPSSMPNAWKRGRANGKASLRALGCQNQ